MLEQLLSRHVFSQVGKTVAPLVQIGLVNLEDIAGKYHFRAISGASNDSFNLVRGEILGLIYDEEHFAKTAAADVGQGSDEKFFVLQEILYAQGLFAGRTELCLDNVKVVHQRLKEGGHLGFFIPGEEANLLIAKYYRRPGKDNLVVLASLFQCRCQRDQSLSRAGSAGQRHKFDIRIKACVDGKLLLVVAGFDAVGFPFAYKADDVPVGVVAGADEAVFVYAQLVQLVGSRFFRNQLIPGRGIVLSVGNLITSFWVNSTLSSSILSVK